VSFSAAWLSLREPFDGRARNPRIMQAAFAALGTLSSVNITDLACGTGSTYRALSPKISAKQNWRLVDNDLSLLARASKQAPSALARISALPVDLARDVEVALDGALDLVTTSALLDLVSAEWLERLAVEVAVRRVPFYAALTYNGRIAFDPADSFDPAIIDAVNRHQRRDKGFGPALGPSAADAAVRQFEAVGYLVEEGLSDWAFLPADREIQREILAGWAAAAGELGDLPLKDIASWLARRQVWVSTGASRIEVGHVDFLARPAEPKK
jgi:SAM-dependent methyltransferase